VKKKIYLVYLVIYLVYLVYLFEIYLVKKRKKGLLLSSAHISYQ